MRLIDPDGKQEDAITFILKNPEIALPVITALPGPVSVGAGVAVLITVYPDELGTQDVNENKPFDIYLPTQEKIESTNDQVVTDNNWQAQHGKQNLKESGKIGQMTTEELVNRQKELSGKRKSKEEKSELNKIKQELKQRGYRKSRQNSESKTEPRVDPYN